MSDETQTDPVDETEDLPLTETDVKLSHIERYERKVKEAKKKRKYSRTPVSGGDRLMAPVDPDKRFRYVRMDPGRVERFLDAGYTIERSRDGIDTGSMKVGDYTRPGAMITKSGGQGDTLVLMSLPKVLYDADQRKKAEKIDELEKSMKSDSQTPDSSGQYGKVQVERDVA